MCGALDVLDGHWSLVEVWQTLGLLRGGVGEPRFE